MIWLDGNRVQIDPPKKPKKLTATRFASVLGLNPWATPFAAWCEITRTYQEPFVDTIYTRAGKAIEPKQIEYMRRAYAMTDIITPTDVYGPDYFKKTWGASFTMSPFLGACGTRWQGRTRRTRTWCWSSRPPSGARIG